MSPTARTARSRPDAAATFFENLVSKGHEPLLHHASGTVRFDLRDGEAVEHWYLTMVKGAVSVSHRNAKADAAIRMDRKLFEGMTRGTVNLTASLLRGLLEVEGDLGLLSAFDRLLPGPRRSRASFLERQEELAG
ncbi:MAG: SCP2 sterol-binding domain-containing protein [Acidimicrobiales bacterium]|jgi:putative sterol carrier protein